MVVIAPAVLAAGKALGTAALSNVGGIMSFFGGKKDNSAALAAQQFEYQKLLNQQQYDLTQQGYRESPLNQRIGYESAGINPILAMSNGATFGSYSGGSAGMPHGSSSAEIGNMITNAYKAFQLERNKTNAEILGINAGIKNTNADTALKAEQTMTERSKQIQMDFQNAMMDVQTHLARKDLNSYDRRFYQEMYESMQRAENYRAEASVAGYNAETARINAEANAYDMNFRKDHPIYNWIDRSTGMVGNAVSAGVNVYNARTGRMNAMANVNNSYSNGYERYTQRFDSKGNYRGHTREVYTKR